MPTFEEAYAALMTVAKPIGRERVAIGEAASRILFSPVLAEVASPPADVSAMDGYAVRDRDPPPFRLIGASYPARAFNDIVRAGECVRILTGAIVPRGADRVIVQELACVDCDQVTLRSEPGTARHIRKRGSDFEKGDEILATGRRLDPRAMVAAAASDRVEVEVYRRPRVAILGTGDELASPGTAKQIAGRIPDSVTFGVAALIQQYGGQCVSRHLVADDLAAIEAAAKLALQTADIVVITGGASVGEKDFAKTAFANLGLELIFTKVAIKPGKPVWLGQARERLVMGLPGNPASALVTGRLLLAPLVAAMGGSDPALHWQEAELAGPLGATGNRETFVRGRRQGASVLPLTNQDTGAQRALADADLLIRRPAGTPASAIGERVHIIEF